MPGLDDILNNIRSQQKLTEENILNAARSKAYRILAEGQQKAEEAFKEHTAKVQERYEQGFVNACNSIDAANRRKLLACRVECIDQVIDRVLEKLCSLPDKDYFDALLRLAEKNIRSGNGVMMLGKKDLERVPADLAAKLSQAAEKKGGTLVLSDEPADINSGFMLQYGLITENCSFEAIIEAEKESIRDTIANELFGQVKK